VDKPETSDDLEANIEREQQKLSKSIEIVGVPNATNNNACEPSQKLFKDALNVDVAIDDIADCFVKPSGRKNSSQTKSAAQGTDVHNNNTSSNKATICVRFSSAAVKKSVLVAKKASTAKLAVTLLSYSFFRR